MKKTMFVPAFSALMFFSVIKVNAQQSSPPELRIEPAGKINNQNLFRIACSNTDASVYFISIQDAEGYVFYEERFKDTTYNKRFLIDIPDTDEANIIITLTGKKGNEMKRYRISYNHTQVSELLVSRD
jgi:hypothetical protein